MRYLWAIVGVGLIAFAGISPPSRGASASAPRATPTAATKHCTTKFVTKRVHGHKQRIKVRTCRKGRTTKHYEYVFVDHDIYIYDIDHGNGLVKTLYLSQVVHVKGVVANPATGMLYLSCCNTGSAGTIVKYDLVNNRVVWTHSYSPGTDSICVTPNGATLYIPTGDFVSGAQWLVASTSGGDVTTTITVAYHPHNTICSPGGSHVYLGATGYNYLNVASTATNTVTERIGPLDGGVRPFTINGKETLAFVTTNGLLGFDVADLKTGKKLYTVSPPGFCCNPTSGTASHGVAMTPDEKEVWVIDQPNDYVHTFDVTGLPSSPPKDIADIKLQGSLSGTESTGAGREGWLNISRDGRYVYVGDAGDVIDTATKRTVMNLSTLANTRQFLEIDFQNGVPIFSTSRYAMGYVTK